jgi:hypothetical protein
VSGTLFDGLEQARIEEIKAQLEADLIAWTNENIIGQPAVSETAEVVRTAFLKHLQDFAKREGLNADGISVSATITDQATVEVTWLASPYLYDALVEVGAIDDDHADG